MELRVFVEPQQGASYDDQLAAALATEEAGLGAFFRSDHYLHMGDPPGGHLPGPSDAWATLAGLARETSRIRLGTLLSAATFRLPGPLAIAVAQVDEMSGGRIELGLGAGWYEAEHLAYGIPFPRTAAERLERLEEQLTIITGLWATEESSRFTYEGRYYQLKESPGLPKPRQQPGPPIIVGGHGTVRTPAIAARFAAECNVSFASDEGMRAVFEGLDRACEKVGRDPASVVRSAGFVTCCAEDEASLASRAKRIGREVGELRAHGLAGSPREIADRLVEVASLGVSRVYLQCLDMRDLEHIRLLGEELAPLVAAL
jgi:F420-dependent oxidoreductase-like protein